MTERRLAVEHLPMLTEVVEYDGDVIRLRSLPGAVGHDDGAKQPLAAVSDGDAALVAADGAELERPASDPPPALPWPETATGEFERRLADALDQRLEVAFAAIFERAAEAARRECQALMLEAVRDLRRQGQQGLDVDSTTRRPADAR